VIAQFDPDDQYLPTSRLNIRKTDSRTGRLGDTIFDTAGSEGDGEPRFRRESEATRAREKEIKAARAAIENIIQSNAGVKGSRTGRELKVIRDILDVGSNENERDTDTGDPGTLFDFISMGIQDFSAKRYMVILSGHGAGTEEDFLLKDNSSGRSLSIPTLRRVFERIQKHFGKKERDNKAPVIDILGMDACCMSMAEIAYELNGLVKTIVASESYSPAAGWPYREIIGRLEFGFSGKRRRGSQDVQAGFAKAIVDEFINFYADYTLGGLSVDQAALNVGGAERLKNVVKKLAKELKDTLIRSDQRKAAGKSPKRPTKTFKDALLLAHWEAQSYSGELFVDLLDFCDCLKKHYPVGNIEKACNRVIRFLKSGSFVMRSAHSGPAYQYSNGVSIYFPWANVAPFYRETRFAQKSDWADFLDLYTNKTRRDVRVDPGILKRLSEKTKELLECNRHVGVAGAVNGATSEAPTNLRQVEVRQVGGRQVGGRQVGGRQVGGKQVGGKQVGGKGSENPIISMRNPPIVYLPDERIRAKVPLIKAQGKLFLEAHRSKGSRK